MHPRMSHTMAALTLAPGVTEVSMFGGSPKWDPDATSVGQLPTVAETTMLRIGEHLVTSHSDLFSLRGHWIHCVLATNKIQCFRDLVYSQHFALLQLSDSVCTYVSTQ